MKYANKYNTNRTEETVNGCILDADIGWQKGLRTNLQISLK